MRIKNAINKTLMKKIFICILAALFLIHALPIAVITKADSEIIPVSGSAGVPAKQCHQIYARGYLYDSFEKAEYVNGLLVLHLKLKTPYNDGRVGGNGLDLYAADCSHEFFSNPTPGIKFRPGMQFFSIRFDAPNHFDFWDDEQDIKMNCTACSVNIPALTAAGKSYESVGYDGFIDGGASTINSGSYPILQNGDNFTKNPLILIPGILGSVLSSADQILWPNLDKMILDPNSSFMDPLQMDAAGRATDFNIHDTDILRSINYKLGEYHYSDQLISNLQQNGYLEGKNLFLFHYDWRLDASSIADSLKGFVSDVLQKTGAGKIDFIAHSYGGLILKQYLLSASDNIGKVIFVAVPNLGSAEAAKALIFGDNLNIPLLSSDEILKLAQNMPSIYELLPSMEYFKNIPGFYDDLSTIKIRNILGYDDSRNMLLNLAKNKALLNEAESLHTENFDNMDFTNKPYDVYNIVGCGVFTDETINKMYDGEPGLLQRAFVGPKYRIMGGSGDGTVLLKSAKHILLPQGHTYFASKVQHSQMLSNPDVINLLDNLLNFGNTNLKSGKISTDPLGCVLQGRLVSFSNNLDFNVTDSSGQIVKPMDYINTTIGNDRQIFIPSDQDYRIKIKPNEIKEPEEVSVTKINNHSIQTINYKNIKIDTSLMLSLKADNNDTMQNIGDNGTVKDIALSETLDENFEPEQQSISTGIYSANNIAPNNGILTLDPSNPYIYFKATSSTSDILDTEYSLDNGSTWNVSSNGMLADIPLNTSQIDFFSEDKAGNVENQESVYLKWQVQAQPQQAPENLAPAIPIPSLGPQITDQNTDPSIQDNQDFISDDDQNYSNSNADPSGKDYTNNNLPQNLSVNIEVPNQGKNIPEIIYLTPQINMPPEPKSNPNTVTEKSEKSTDKDADNYWNLFRKAYNLIKFSAHLIFF